MTHEKLPHITRLYRYPIKGFAAQSLDSAILTPGETLPFDRIYAVENGPGRFDQNAPRHLPKINFLMLMRNEKLATLEIEFDTDSHTLIVKREGRQVAKGNLKTKIGRQMIEQFLAAYLQDDLRGSPKIVFSEGHSFTDVSEKCVHIVNLASVRDLERISGQPVDPLRFRANIYIDGLEPWKEFDWINNIIEIEEARLEVFARTDRCEATSVDPETGQRGLAITAMLKRQFGHNDFGIYAKVLIGQEVAIGHSLTVTLPSEES